MKPPPIVAGVAIGVAGAALLIVPIFASLERLSAVSGERAALQAAIAKGGGSDRVPAMRAADGKAAQAALVGRLKQMASRGGLLIEEVEPTPADDGIVRVRLRVSGREGAAIALADSLERDAPLARLAAWRIERAGDAVRLSAEVVAPWR